MNGHDGIMKVLMILGQSFLFFFFWGGDATFAWCFLEWWDSLLLKDNLDREDWRLWYMKGYMEGEERNEATYLLCMMVRLGKGGGGEHNPRN